MWYNPRMKHHDLEGRCSWCYQVHNPYITADMEETNKSDEVRLMSSLLTTVRKPA